MSQIPQVFKLYMVDFSLINFNFGFYPRPTLKLRPPFLTSHGSIPDIILPQTSSCHTRCLCSYSNSKLILTFQQIFFSSKLMPSWLVQNVIYYFLGLTLHCNSSSILMLMNLSLLYILDGSRN